MIFYFKENLDIVKGGGGGGGPHTNQEPTLFIYCLGSAYLCDSSFPIIDHREGRPIYLGLSMVLEQDVLLLSDTQGSASEPTTMDSNRRKGYL